MRGECDHPNETAVRLVPKGAALEDFVHSKTRLKYPMVAKAGIGQVRAVSPGIVRSTASRAWSRMTGRELRRDQQRRRHGHRWTSVGFSCGIGNNETKLPWATYKVVRSFGVLGFDKPGAGLTTDLRCPVLGPTFGRGAMTNSWTDIRNTDLAIVMGGNSAEAHPCGFKWVTEAKANRGARLIVVDPRYTRTVSVSDLYAPIRQGSDIAFFSD